MKLSGKSVQEVALLMGHKNVKVAQTTYDKKLAGYKSFAPDQDSPSQELNITIEQPIETGQNNTFPG